LALINQGDSLRLRIDNYHQRGAQMVPQGVLGFQYEADRSSGGLTSLAGLPLYLDLIEAIGLGARQSASTFMWLARRVGSTSRWCWR
jgi:hypothetical protein